MIHRSQSSTLVAALAMPLTRGALIALQILTFIILYLTISASAAHAGEVNCRTPRGALDQYMCQLSNNSGYAGIKMFFQYGGSGVSTSNTNASVEPMDAELSASLTKIVPVYLMLELLSNNEGTAERRTQPFVRNGWTLDTKIRIIPNRNQIPAGYDAGPNIVYLSEGFASSTCNTNGGWQGVANMANLAMYTPEHRYEYTINQLLRMAMAYSANDAATIIGALVASNIAQAGQYNVAGGGSRAFTLNEGNVNNRVNKILGVANPLRPGAEGAHMTWITPFRDVLTQTARMFGASNTTNICNPPGWASTASGGCSAVSTVQDWMNIARGAYRNAVDNSSTRNYAAYFAPLAQTAYTTHTKNSQGVCRHNVSVDIRSTGARLLLASNSGEGSGSVKLVKTGTIPPPYNMIALAEPAATGNCDSEQMVAVVMGLRNRDAGRQRANIIAEMFSKGRQQFSRGCDLQFDMARASDVLASAYLPNMSEEARSVAQTFVSDDTDLQDVLAIVPPQETPGTPPPGGGTDNGPSGGASSTAGDEQCAPELLWAEQIAEDWKSKTNFGIYEEYMNNRVDEIFGQQCIGKLITLMQQITSTIDTIRTLISSADMMGAIIQAAAGAIVRAILDKFFSWLTNQICNVTNAITGAIDNVSKNLLCFKKPLFSISNDPLRIPIDIEDISCSGIAVNPLYFSGDPSQPLARGSIGGVNLGQFRSGDRPYFCPLGTRPANAQQSGGTPTWDCEPIPGYTRPDPTPVARILCSKNNVWGFMQGSECVLGDLSNPSTGSRNNTVPGGNSGCPAGTTLVNGACRSNGG